MTTTTSTLTSGLAPVTEAGVAVCAVIDELAGYLEEQAGPNDRGGRFARDSVLRLNDAGVLAACVPAADGGFGVESLYDLSVITGRLARADASVAVGVTMHLALSWHYARSVRSAEPERRDGMPMHRWQRAIGERAMILCSSVAEPRVAPWALTTSAVRTDGGWRVTGRKVLASISPAATHFYSRVRGETDDGPVQASAMIPLARPGVEVLDNWDGVGLRGSGSGEVVFRDVELGPDEVTPRGPWGAPLKDGYDGRAAQTAPIVSLFLGIAEAARGHGLAGLRDLAGSDGARGASAGTAQLTAEMELRMGAARGVLHTALSTLDDALTRERPRSLPTARGLALVKEIEVAAMIVERAAMDVIDLATQMCGGRAYRAGHPLARLARDVRAAWFMRPWVPSEEWVDFLSHTVQEEIAPVAEDSG